MKSLRFTAIVLLAAVAGAAVFSRVATSQATFTPVKVAFLDVSEVFRKYKKARDVNQQVQREMLAVDKELRKRAEELIRKGEELRDLYDPNSVEFLESRRKLDFEEFELKYDQKTRRRAILGAAVKRMNLVYTEIRREAENYARRNQLHAVMMHNDADIEARSLEELQLLIASRPVIYREKGLDITPHVIEVLNKQ